MNKYNLEVYLEDLYFSSKNQECPISIEKWQLWAETWLNSLDVDLDADSYEMSLVLTDDQEIKQLNHQFRHQNKPTDVLAFAALETDFPNVDIGLIDAIPLGDVIISVETAQKQAESQQHSLDFELVWLAVHGFLHLLGWDHPDDESLAIMLEQQRILLKKNNLVT